MEKIQIWDKTFVPYITYEELMKDIDAVAIKLNEDYSGAEDVPVLLSILNGAMMFTSELMKRLDFNCELMSTKLKSYSGTQSAGVIKEAMGLTGDISGRRVIIVEDIVDTGVTMSFLTEHLRTKGAKDVRICTMLFKPEALKKEITIDYVAREVPNLFVVGFGLDYNELGRNYKDIYVLDK